MSKVKRRTLKFIQHYPNPRELYQTLMRSPGWAYKTNLDFYHKRDRALVALTYLIAARISEVLRLEKNQFSHGENCLVLRGIRLSKKVGFRDEAFLPLSGERAELSLLVSEYLDELGLDEKLFNFGRKRAWQIFIALMGEPCHWFRAYGENYLYDVWGKDILAVSDYINVDVQTLQKYIRRSYRKYKPA